MCKIKFEILNPGPIEVRVVDIIGVPITSFVDEYEPGNHEVEFNDEQLLPGSYYYKILASSDRNTSITGINGFDRLLQTGTLKVRTNGINSKFLS